MQYLIVCVVIVIAVVYLAMRAYRSITRRSKGTSSKCDGCTCYCGLRDTLALKKNNENCRNDR